MFRTLINKIFNHDNREKHLENILTDLKNSIVNIKEDYDLTKDNIKILNSLYEEKLHHEKLLKSIYEISMTLFKNNDIEKSLLTTLQIITVHKCCQKSFIFVNNFSKTSMFADKQFEWCDTTLNDVKETNIELLDWNYYLPWANKLTNGLFVNGNIDNFKRSNSRQFLKGLGLKSVLMLPIFIDQTWWGTLVLGSINNTHWSNKEIEVLSSICNIMGTAIKRYQLQQNTNICCNGSINFLKKIVDEIDGVAFWLKDIHHRYVFADKILCKTLYPQCEQFELIGKTDYQLISNTFNYIDPIDFSKINDFSQLNELDLSYYDQIQICNITDQITQHFKQECNFFEKINDRYFEVLKSPLFRQGVRGNDDLNTMVCTGTAGALIDVTDKKDKKLAKLQDLISDNLAIQIGNTDNYFLYTKLFSNNQSLLV